MRGEALKGHLDGRLLATLAAGPAQVFGGVLLAALLLSATRWLSLRPRREHL
jgi:hypothetical protein